MQGGRAALLRRTFDGRDRPRPRCLSSYGAARVEDGRSLATQGDAKQLGAALTPERWAQIEQLFHRAAESDPQHRAAVLDEGCGNDSELREQVEALLSSDKSARCRVQAAV